MLEAKQSQPVMVDTSRSEHAVLRGVPLIDVRLSDDFWGPRRRINREVTLPSQHRHLEETGRLDNFRRAAGKIGGSFRAEGIAYVVGEPAGDAEEAFAPGSAVVGDGGLDQVPRAVELVLVGQVRPPLGRLFEDEVGVQVAVILLGVFDLGDDGIHHPLQLWIRVGG